MSRHRRVKEADPLKVAVVLVLAVWVPVFMFLAAWTWGR